MRLRVILLFFSIFLFCSGLRATMCYAIANGNWTAPSTWSCGRAPTHNDTIWVPVGFTVTVDVNSPNYNNMLLIVDGTLNFMNGMKINICPAGGVYLSPTGILMGGTPGSKIDICNTTVWNGPGPTGGPQFWGNVILPVELLSFTGHLTDQNQVLLSWTTATETNNDFFTVERSVNGFTFEAIGTVEGSGTTSQPHDYTFTDPAPAVGTNYYRLRQTDYNGRSETFNIVAINFQPDEGSCVLSVYPNPCVEQCTVTFSDCPSDSEGNVVVEVIDAYGQTVSSSVPQRDGNGAFLMKVDAKNNLSPGVYIIRATTAKKSYAQKAVLK